MLHPKYRPDIDGLRALAVLSVVIFHFFPYRLPGGFVGVDVFFVISGYLITGIITGSLEKSSFSFRDFYVRRVRRIFPALLVVMTACLAAGWYLLLSDEFKQLGKHMATAGAFIVNLTLWQEAGYFDTASTKKILLHLWSLGIEEQFYIFWPFIVWGLSRHGRKFLVPSISLTAGSFAINLLMVKHYPAGDFYSPFSRFWELSTGAVLASFNQQYPRFISRFPTMTSATGLVLIAAALAVISEDSAFPGGWAMLPVVGAALIIAAGPAALPNRLLLANRPAVFIGRISYPLYLWHWPLLAFGYVIVHVSIPDRNTRLVMMAASFVLAWLTTRFVEPQFRFKNDRLSLSILCGGSISLIILGILSWQGILPPRHNDARLAPIMQAIAEEDYPPAGFKHTVLEGSEVLQKGTSQRKTLFVGDSHMEHYAARINYDLASMPHANTAVLLTHSSCPPVKMPINPEPCAQMQDAFRKIAMRPDVDTIVLGGAWESYVYETPDKNLFKSAMFSMLLNLTQHKRVFLILDNPQGPGFDPKNAVDGASRFGELRFRSALARVPRNPKEVFVNDLMRDAAKQAGASVLDPVPLLCQAQLCATTMDDGHPIYKDSSHLRSVYTRQYAAFLDQTMRASH